jgi:hypothetical protein
METWSKFTKCKKSSCVMIMWRWICKPRKDTYCLRFPNEFLYIWKLKGLCGKTQLGLSSFPLILQAQCIMGFNRVGSFQVNDPMNLANWLGAKEYENLLWLKNAYVIF